MEGQQGGITGRVSRVAGLAELHKDIFFTVLMIILTASYQVFSCLAGRVTQSLPILLANNSIYSHNIVFHLPDLQLPEHFRFQIQLLNIRWGLGFVHLHIQKDYPQPLNFLGLFNSLCIFVFTLCVFFACRAEILTWTESDRKSVV